MKLFREKQRSIHADEIGHYLSAQINSGIKPYLDAMDSFVIIHNKNLQELNALLGEISIFHIVLFHNTCSMIECPEKLRDSIIPPMTACLKITPERYVERSQKYFTALDNIKSELVPMTASSIFSEIIDSEYSGYKVKNGNLKLTNTFTALAFKSIKKLGNQTLNFQRQYQIIY